MKYVFGLIAAILSLSCIGLVALFAVALAIRLKEEKRVWTEYPAMLVEHWWESAIFLGLLFLGFAFFGSRRQFPQSPGAGTLIQAMRLGAKVAFAPPVASGYSGGMDNESPSESIYRLLVTWVVLVAIGVVVAVFATVGIEELEIGPGDPVARFYKSIGLWKPVDAIADALAWFATR